MTAEVTAGRAEGIGERVLARVVSLLLLPRCDATASAEVSWVRGVSCHRRTELSHLIVVILGRPRHRPVHDSPHSQRSFRRWTATGIVGFFVVTTQGIGWWGSKSDAISHALGLSVVFHALP
jgi:hypothetical protein